MSGVTFNLTDVVLDGGAMSVWQGTALARRTPPSPESISAISRAVRPAARIAGIAIASYGGTVAGGSGSDSHGAGGAASDLVVIDSTFEQIGRIGVLVKGDGATATITGNTYTGKGVGDWLDYAFEVGAGGSADILNNMVSGNLGVAATTARRRPASWSRRIWGAGTSATIEEQCADGQHRRRPCRLR
jgi:hypothetical protein